MDSEVPKVDPVVATEIILLIHGTAAGAAEDEGERWWQRESEFWRALNESVAPRLSCGPNSGPLFHWSGANSERDRRAAGRRLLSDLRRLEEAGIYYHLV